MRSYSLCVALLSFTLAKIPSSRKMKSKEIQSDKLIKIPKIVIWSRRISFVCCLRLADAVLIYICKQL